MENDRQPVFYKSHLTLSFIYALTPTAFAENRADVLSNPYPSISFTTK
jgi:hypothetical protein